MDSKEINMRSRFCEIKFIFENFTPLPKEIIEKILYEYKPISHPCVKQLKKEYDCIKNNLFFKKKNKYYIIFNNIINISESMLNNYNNDNYDKNIINQNKDKIVSNYNSFNNNNFKYIKLETVNDFSNISYRYNNLITEYNTFSNYY